MKYVPKLFKTEMMRANLREENPKTQTRRIIKPQPDANIDHFEPWSDKWRSGFAPRTKSGEPYDTTIIIPGCQAGDIIWARETWVQCVDCESGGEGIMYRADIAGKCAEDFADGEPIIWRPSIFMPKDACRFFALVTSVQAQRVQDISKEDAKAEGVTLDYGNGHATFREAYRELWDDINGQPKPVYGKAPITGKAYIVGYESYPWEDINQTVQHRGLPWQITGNPWVFAYTYKRIEKPEGWPGVAK